MSTSDEKHCTVISIRHSDLIDKTLKLASYLHTLDGGDAMVGMVILQKTLDCYKKVAGVEDVKIPEVTVHLGENDLTQVAEDVYAAAQILPDHGFSKEDIKCLIEDATNKMKETPKGAAVSVHSSTIKPKGETQ